jgi:iron complex outermembrane receptor protein
MIAKGERQPMQKFGERTKSSLAILSLALASVGAWSAPALAQDAADDGNSGEIVVTAQKREQRLQDVPAAVTVVDGDILDGGAAYNVEGITALVPTLSFNKGGTSLNSSLFMRGVGTINFSVAAEPSVAFVLDGVVLARAGEAFGDLYDAERIEVLRGPQGTLFGKNASAGVVNVVSKMPGSTYGGQVDVSYFEGNEQRVKASVDVPLSETFRTRLTAFGGTYDGNIRNLARNSDINGYDRWGVRGIAVWEASPNLEFTLIGDYRHAADNCCAPVVGVQPTGATGAALTSLLAGVPFLRDETRTVRQDTITQTKEDSWGVSLQADLAVGNHTLTSISAYRAWDNVEIREGDFLGTRVPAYVGNAFNRVQDFGPQESTTFSQEIRLTSPDDQPFTYVLGGYYYDADADRTFRRDVSSCTASTLALDATGQRPCTVSASTIVSTFARAEFGSEFKNLAVFADGELDLGEQLSLIGGLRYTRDELSAYHVRTNLATPSLPGISNNPNNVRLSTEETNVSGRFGARYAVSDDIVAYGTYSRGYKGPAYNVFFQMNANPAVNQSNVIEAETVDSVEFGLKTAWFDNRFLVNLAVFDADYENFQANNFDNQGGVIVTRLTNAGDVSTKGFEVDVLLRASETFSLNAGLAITDAQIEAFRDPTGVVTTARAGEQLAFAPDYKGTVGFNKEWNGGPLNVYLTGSWSFVSDQFPDLGANPALRIDSSDLVDASLGFSDANDRLRVTLIGKNLLDDSFPSLVQSGGPGGFVHRIPREADRYYGVSARLRLGS